MIYSTRRDKLGLINLCEAIRTCRSIDMIAQRPRDDMQCRHKLRYLDRALAAGREEMMQTIVLSFASLWLLPKNLREQSIRTAATVIQA